MASTPELPAELWIKILQLATEPHHPGEIDGPVLDWHTSHRLLHRSSAMLCKEARGNRTALSLVCSQWNAIVTASLYEHIRVDFSSISRLASLPGILEIPLPQRPSVLRGALVKRLDLELIDTEFGPWHPRNTEALDPSHFDSIVRLLTLLPNLTTLLLLLPPCAEPKTLMDAVSPSIQRFYWKAAGKTPMSIHRILAFLDTHPAITSMAFPEFNASNSGSEPQEFSADWTSKTRPLIREWILREERHSFSASYLCTKGLFPGLVSRSVGYLVDIPQPGVPDWVNTDFSLAVSPMVQPTGGGRMIDTIHPNPSINQISILESFHGSWPTQSFSKKLLIMKRQCPNVQELYLTLAGNMTSNDRAVKEMRADDTELPAITTLSLLRISNEWPVPDALDSLHHILRIPWTQTFPQLQRIRVMEEINLRETRYHPTLGFIRAQDWTIRVEDRFGGSLV